MGKLYAAKAFVVDPDKEVVGNSPARTSETITFRYMDILQKQGKVLWMTHFGD